MDMQKERELFNKEFGISDADIFPATEKSLSDSAVLKCNWLGWIKRAEYEYRENPEKIEIEGLETIHELCNFGAENGLEGCTFTEIVECMFDDLKELRAQLDSEKSLRSMSEHLNKVKQDEINELKASAVPQWISVDDQMPPVDETVLVCWDYVPDIEPDKEYITIDEDLNEYWPNCQDEPPTHWMVLPKVIKAAQEQSNESE